MILLSLVSFGSLWPLGVPTHSIFQPHVGLFFLLPTLGFYLSLDFWSGLFAAIFYSGGYLFFNHLFLLNGDDHVKCLAWCQLIAWTLQFIGHGVFENKRPALVDNFLLTIAAPLFVVLEVMMAFGYKTYLHDLITNRKDN